MKNLFCFIIVYHLTIMLLWLAAVLGSKFEHPGWLGSFCLEITYLISFH